MAFADPVEIDEQSDDATLAQLFRKKWRPDRWSHQLEGEEHVVCLIFEATGVFTSDDAKQLANWVKNQRPEILRGGAMYAGQMPTSGDFPANHDVHFVVNFELKPTSSSLE
jgi:hypothetical protein